LFLILQLQFLAFLEKEKNPKIQFAPLFFY